jgi:Fe-S cluster assembly protein SufD
MNTVEFYKGHFNQLEASSKNGNGLSAIRKEAFAAFSKMGIPTVKHEEWKYTRISGLFNKEYKFSGQDIPASLSATDIDPYRLPGYSNANELVFINC